MPADPHTVRGFAARVVVAIAIAAAFAAAWWASDVLFLVFGGVLVAIILRGLARWVSSHTGLGITWAFSVVILGILAVAGAGAYFLGSRIADQVGTLSEQLPAAVAELRRKLEAQPWAAPLLHSVSPTRMLSGSGNWLSQISGAFSSALTVLADFVVVAFVGIYLALDPGLYRRGLLALAPAGSDQRVNETLDAIHHALQHWLMGKLALMAFVGVVTALGLAIIGVPLIFTLALLAALLDFIPNIGPIVSAIPAVLLALSTDPMKAVWVALLFLVVQFVESYILAPIVQKRAVELPPALLIVAQLLLGVVFGPMGLIFATPLTVVILTVVKSSINR